MKVWIDLMTPKDVKYFLPLIVRLQKHGIKTIVTARAHREVLGLCEFLSVRPIVVGGYGKSLKEKLLKYIERVAKLTELVSEENPNLALSFSSPECARVAFGLRIPHFCANDSPHTVASPKLTIPLSEKLFTTWIIPVKAWTQYGIDKRRVIRYRALDPIAWLMDFKPDRRVLDELSLDESRPIVTVRALEVFAVYVHGERDPSISVARLLRSELGSRVQIVLLPRYEEQVREFREKLKDPCYRVAEKPLDATSLIYYSHALICSGGTMSQEGALLGTPTVTVFPERRLPMPLFIIDWLAKKRLLLKTDEPREIVRYVRRAISDERFREKLRRRASRIRRKMEDPAEVILKHVLDKLSELRSEV